MSVPRPCLTAETPPACLYPGRVMHARLCDTPHRFNYDVVSLLIDLDRLDEAGRLSPLFAVNKPGFVSFQEKDHGPGAARGLRAHVDALVAEAGLTTAPHRVTLLCYPRVLGYVFNPLSVYFAFGATGQVMALIYEVRNTFGDMHSYVIPVSAAHKTPAGIRQGCAKSFYVSPFMGMAQRYHFRVQLPAETSRLRILETDENGPSLSACFSGTRQALTTQTLMRCFAKRPWASLKVTLGIHLEALQLWFKGAKFHQRPQAWTGHSVIMGEKACPLVRPAGSLSN